MQGLHWGKLIFRGRNFSLRVKNGCSTLARVWLLVVLTCLSRSLKGNGTYLSENTRGQASKIIPHRSFPKVELDATLPLRQWT